MDLLQENPVKENKTKKLRNSLIVIGALIAILIIVAIVIYVYTLQVAQNQFKVYIDDSRTTAIENEEVFYIRDDKVFISISDIVDRIGYRLYNGEYKQYTEDTTNCYATNSKELVTFAAGATSIRKYPQLSDSESQQFDLDEPIVSRGNKLYISEDGLKRAFNLVFTYNKNTNTVQITTLQYLSTQYEKNVTNCSLSKSDLSEAVVFDNQKALLYGLIVVQDPDTELFGVSNSVDGTIKNIITERYESVQFIEGINDFIVKTEDQKYGIIGNDGITKVKPQYDNIQEIDKDLGLYLVESNGIPGVVNESGKIIIYQDFDRIGLEGEIKDGNVTNRYLLYGNVIPVKKGEKWGLYDKTGAQILPVEYDGIGCDNINLSNSTGIILIPDMDEGIVIERDQTVDREKIKKYGIISSTGNSLVNVVADSIYATTLENKTTYYVNVQNQVIDIVNYWLENKEKAQKDYAGNNNLKQETTTNQEQTINDTELSEN